MPTAIYPYLYKSSGWRDQLVSYNGETFEYDELGNPTTCRGETFVWNGRQLVQLGDCKYTYNASGIRTSKIVNGIKTKFYLNGNKILAQDDGNKIYYHYGTDGIVGFTLKLSDTIIYEYTYKKNIQGDIIGIYDSNNVLICKYIYDAWGNHKTLILSNNGEYIDISSTSDYTNINNNYIFIATLNPFRYRGYYFDTDTGLYYLNSRYYDPELGRFINADSLDNIDTENLNGFNLYMYCADNPVNYFDPNGEFLFTLIASLVCTTVIGYIAYRGIEAATNAQVANGTTSITGGMSTIFTSLALFSFGPVGWILGGIGIIAGIGTTLFGTAELQQGITGNNWIKDAGMSDSTYNALYLTASLTSLAVSIGGSVYMTSLAGQRAYAYQNIGKYRYTKTVAGHYPERSYIYNISIQRQIIKYGKITRFNPRNPNSIFLKGSFEFKYGNWELTINNIKRFIIHFLYRGH